MVSYISVTFNDPAIKVNFGAYANHEISPIHVFNARTLENVRIHPENHEVVVAEVTSTFDTDKKEFPLAWQQGFHLSNPNFKAFIVDSIEGLAPTSAEDLLDKVSALMR